MTTWDRLGDREQSDHLMAEGIALRPLRVPFPEGFDSWTDAEVVTWFNGSYRLAAGKLIDADTAARRASALEAGE